MDRYDIIVIGAGVTGLITARDAARNGATVKIIEASGRVGGQVWSIRHEGVAQTIALGAEWLHSVKHEVIFQEMAQYGIPLDRFRHKREYCLYGGKNDKAKVDELPMRVAQMQTDPLYASAMKTINWDVSFIVFNKGFDQPDSEQYDMPFQEYVITRLKLPETSFVYEYIMMQTFHFTGGNPLTQSALGVLYIVAGFRTAEKAYGMEGHLLSRYPTSLGLLVEKITEEIISLGVTIEFNMPVVSVRKEEVLLPPNRVANYDYPALPDRERIVYVKCTTKAEFCTRSVIVCVPMKCITSILFYPSLPLAVTKAAERCNAGADQIKMYAFAAGVSSDIARLLTVQCECRETYTVARHHHYNPHATTPTNSNGTANAAALLAAATVSAKGGAGTGRGRRTLTVNYNRATAPGNDDHTHNHTLICTNGSRHDLMRNVARNLRKIHPVIELPNDNNHVTPGASQPASRPSTTTSMTVGGRRPSTPLIDHRGGALSAVVGDGQQVVSINTSAYTVSHDNSIVYHDFLSDVCSRGTWFNLRSGTAYLHVLAIKAARMPWDRSNNIHTNQGVTQSVSQNSKKRTNTITTGGAAPEFDSTVDTTANAPITAKLPDSTDNKLLNQQYVDDLSLIITGGELYPEWTGWVEGAARAGAEAAKRVIPYLFPPKVERNFAKKATQVSPMKSIGYGGAVASVGSGVGVGVGGGLALPVLHRSSAAERRSYFS